MNQTIQQIDSGRNNNFNLLRFVAATMVIFSHAYWLTGNQPVEPLHKLCGILDFGSLGVKIFFTVSGYLITKSICQRKHLGNFIWARILRIFPGLFFSSLFCVFVIGPLCTNLPLGGYFKNWAIYDFIWRTTTLHKYPNVLPGVFQSNPISGNVNSPIWTLPAELFMYMCVFTLGAIWLLLEKQFKSLVVFFLVIAIYIGYWGIADFSSYLKYLDEWGLLFFGGMVCYLLRDRIILSIPVFVVMCVVFLILFHIRFVFVVPALNILLIYGVLIFVYHPFFQVNSFRKAGDFSYGLYIYALPIQQLIVSKWVVLKPATLFFTAYPLALGIAVLSWYFIEKPILKLKDPKSKPFSNKPKPLIYVD